MSKDRRKLFRLLDLLVEEVSIVDRAANKRRFLLVKREKGEGMEFNELLEALASMPTFAAGLSAEEQTELAGALRKAADGIPVPDDASQNEPESSEPAADDVNKGEDAEDLNSEPAADDDVQNSDDDEPAADDVQKSDESATDDPDPLAAIMSKLDGMETAIGGVSDKVSALDSRLSTVEKSVYVPASGVVESTGTEPVGNPSASSIPWEMDINTATD